MPASPSAETTELSWKARLLQAMGSTASVEPTVDVWKFGLLWIEIFGLACLVKRYALESDAFFEVFLIAAVGFAIHYFLPLRARMGFFLLLSLISIVSVLGVISGLWLIVIALALVAIMHLAVPMAVRVGLIALVGVGLAGMRAGWISAPWSVAVWPIIASMFMFRLMVYGYDLYHGQGPKSWTQRLAYFLMLPNVCFPLFPVVDSRTFVRTYYDSEQHEIYQRGVEWILRGMVQLILYRLVYQLLVIDPNQVANSADLLRYLVSLFLLYLRVSGQFHVIVGMLHLFGFHLPETHHLYYFASSFTDFWRRINIYWKDFMMKLFYYPMFFRVRWLGPTWALVVSTAWVFAFTWLLHAYQLFWICGRYEFRWNDLLFWTILCGLVIINALAEARAGRKRVLGPVRLSWKERGVIALKTATTFCVICVLWSFWSSQSIGAWLSLWPAALVTPSSEQIRGLTMVAVAFGVFLELFLAWQTWVSEWIGQRFRWRIALVLGQLFLLNALSITSVYQQFGESASHLVYTARFGGLNSLDRKLLERGYYEDLLAVDRFGELAALYSKRPADWVWLNESDLIQSTKVPGVRYELRPNNRTVFKGASFCSNRWGMHDQEYSLQKPAGCYRIAVLGASHTMGSGVKREQTFEATLERHLNSVVESTTYRKFEVLNFGMGGTYPVEQIQILKERVRRFEPDTMIYVGHPGEAGRVTNQLNQAVQKGASIYEKFLADIVRQVNIDADTPERLIEQRLEPFAEQILERIYGEIVAECERQRIHPVLVRLPLLDEGSFADSETPQVELARRAGFTVFNLDGVYDVPDRESLWIAEWDTHPNVEGHRMVGNRLYQLIRENGPSIGLEFDKQKLSKIEATLPNRN